MNSEQEKMVRKGHPVLSIDGSVRGRIEEITDSVVIISVEKSPVSSILKSVANDNQELENEEPFKIKEDGTIVRLDAPDNPTPNNEDNEGLSLSGCFWIAIVALVLATIIGIITIATS